MAKKIKKTENEEEIKKQLAELEEVMKETTEVKLVSIYENMLPKDINAAQLTGIQTLIK